MSADQETRDRILRELEEIRKQLPPITEEEFVAELAEDDPQIVTEPYYRWKHLASPAKEELPRQRDSASTRAAS